MTTPTPSVVLNTKKGPSTIKRAIFGPGMLLQSEDLEQLNTYTRDLSRLLFRSFFGCGVVCGLKVSAKTDNCGKTSVTVDAGVALNCLGDPIYVPNPVTFDATDGCDPNNPPLNKLYVWLCSCPKCCAPRTPSCGCDDESKPACTREVDWYEIHLGTDRPDCACGCMSPDEPTSPVAEGDEALVDATGGAAPDPASVQTSEDPCQCADPKSDCYKDHYAGVCGCKCEDSNCVVLAKLTNDGSNPDWTADHCVRRFIRPVLVRDPACPPPAADQGPQSEPTPAPAMLMKKPAAKTRKTRHPSK